MRPVLEAGLQRVLDQQGAKPGTIDKQVGRDHRAAFKPHAFDKAALAVLRDGDNLAFGAHDALRLGAASQEARIEDGVEMIGIGDLGQGRVRRRITWRRHELAERCRHRIERIEADILAPAHGTGLQPVLMERHQAEIAADRAEAMDVGVADFSPVVELDAQLESALGCAHEGCFIDPQQSIEGRYMRHGRFTDPDNADLFGFDQLNLDGLAEGFGDGRGAHPAGGAAPDHRDCSYGAFRRLLRHCPSTQVRENNMIKTRAGSVHIERNLLQRVYLSPASRPAKGTSAVRIRARTSRPSTA